MLMMHLHVAIRSKCEAKTRMYTCQGDPCISQSVCDCSKPEQTLSGTAYDRGDAAIAMSGILSIEHVHTKQEPLCNILHEVMT